MQLPLRITLEQRSETPRHLVLTVPVVSIIAALLVGAIFLVATGHDPFNTYQHILDGGFLTQRGITDSLGLATVLICTGMAAAFSFQMNLYNIGGEGQLYLGMLGGAWAGIALGPHLPSYISIPAVMFFSALAGAIWILIPAIVRAKFGTSEIVTTLLLTYVAASLVNYFMYTDGSFFRAPGSKFPEGRRVADSALLDPIGDTRMYPTFFVAIAITLFLYWLVKHSEFGYRIQVISDSPRAAQYAGISANRTTISVMLISGALSGLGGAMLIVGQYQKIDPGILLLGYGYAGIVVAALARYNFMAIIVSAILFAGLRTGGQKLQITSDTPIHIGVILQGAVLLFALGGEAFRRYRIRVVRTNNAKAVPA